MYETIESIRDHFVRELRKKRSPVEREAGPEFKSSWHLFEILNFLTDTMKHRP